jgi:hypothetical protein
VRRLLSIHVLAPHPYFEAITAIISEYAYNIAQIEKKTPSVVIDLGEAGGNARLIYTNFKDLYNSILFLLRVFNKLGFCFIELYFKKVVLILVLSY